ncbi:hypothetical protein [Corynebacterium nuruki]|uniref:hypothetical protein n=1 Tax=Corynebacterium nuruki TaxID=1032851 RepID=UPI0039BF8CE2
MAIWIIRTRNVENQSTESKYDDILGASYHYDSMVAYSKAMKAGDIIFIRGNGELLGVSRISSIKSGRAKKEMNRCPHCGATEISLRSTTLDYRCAICKEEFANPRITYREVTSYVADYSKFWWRFSNPIPFNEETLPMKGYRTNAMRKVEKLSSIAQVVEKSGQSTDLIEALSKI